MQDVCVHLSYQGDLPQFISGNEKYHYKRSMGPHQIHTPKTPNTHIKILNTLSQTPKYQISPQIPNIGPQTNKGILGV